MKTDSNPIFPGQIAIPLPNMSSVAWEIWHALADKKNNEKWIKTLLCPDLSSAYALRDDLLELRSDFNVEVLAPLETDLSRNRGPSLHRRCQRIRSLMALGGIGNTRSLVIVPGEVLSQVGPSIPFYLKNCLQIKEGADLSRNQLIESLTLLGFYPAELVERSFQFAGRGSIVDVFAPNYDFPIRLELFEDRVQSLRTFHPESQRRIESLKEIIIAPALGFVFPKTASDWSQTKAKIRACLDSWEWAKADRDALLNQIEQRSLFETLEYWSPLLGSEMARVGDQIEKYDFVVDPESSKRSVLISASLMGDQLKRARLDGEWVPAADVFISAPLQNDSAFAAAQVFRLGSTVGLEQASVQIRSVEPIATQILRASAENDSGVPRPPIESGIEVLRDLASSGYRIVFYCSTLAQLERINFLVRPYGWNFPILDSWIEAINSKSQLLSIVAELQNGFIDEKRKIVLLGEEILLGIKKKKSRTTHSNFKTTEGIQNVFGSDLLIAELKTGDLVVHKEHGIGKYLGLKVMNFSGVPTELFEIEYKDNNKLFVPVTRLGLIQKHSTGGNSAPLDKLGGQTWEEKKSRVKKELRSIAGELLHLYSVRELSKGPSINPPGNKILEFASTFPYTETVDQLKAINDVLKDLVGPKPMDRLVCGDVGYGKTEVAIRAAHAAACCGFQVAVLVPTTLLAIQHEAQFKKRFQGLGIRVDGLSRFKSAKEVKEITDSLRNGKTQIVVGTHKLLSNAVGFSNLGLLIVDEEQRFGVVHKEKIKKLRADIHVLSMTATPIPRTLNMSLSGIRDLSIITTPPQDRMSVRTFVHKKKPSLVREAIAQELKRGGQVFYVHNRVLDIEKELAFLRENSPTDATIEVVHGQMDEDLLEERMLRFYEGKTQILLTTAIIESGLDVPRANTLIVDRADAFGLAQLYQIRGRVGRSNQRGYAYFLLPEKTPITADAEERLRVLEAYQELGSGFHIASHDLEIRGSGDLLGRNQSGSIFSLGFDAYIELLNEAVAEIKGETLSQKIDPEINLGFDAFLPENFIPETGLRLLFYRRLASASNEAEVDQLSAEIEDRFGPPPQSAQNLFSAMRIKCILKRISARSLNSGASGFSVSFDPSTPVKPENLVKAVQKYPQHFQLSPDGRLLIKRIHSETSPAKIVRGIEVALSEIDSWVV